MLALMISKLRNCAVVASGLFILDEIAILASQIRVANVRYLNYVLSLGKQASSFRFLSGYKWQSKLLVDILDLADLRASKLPR